MTRSRLLLVAVIAAELIVGGVLAYRKWSKPVPPLADLSYVDPLAADAIRDRIATCRTPDDWAALGDIYSGHGYFPEAEACYRVAVESEPDRADRQYVRAFALERIGDLEGACGFYERAAEGSHPHPDECRYNAGRVSLRESRVEAARTRFEQAGEQASARYELARLHLRSGQRPDAVAILDRLIAEYPDAVQPYLLRHRIEIESGGTMATSFSDRAERARGRLPTPFDRDWKRLDDAYNSIGFEAERKECELLLANGKIGEAEGRLRSMLQSAWDPAATDLLAEAAFLRNRPDEAARLLQEVVDRAGPMVHFLDRLGDAFMASGQEARSVAAWQQAADFGIGADVKNVEHKLAMHFEKKGDQQPAARHHARAYFAAGHEAFWSGDYASTLAAMSKAIEYVPGLAAAWLYQGEAHRLLGNAGAARAAYRRCLELEPGFGRALTGLALLGKEPPTRRS